jgi:hypothetical protein
MSNAIDGIVSNHRAYRGKVVVAEAPTLSLGPGKDALVELGDVVGVLGFFGP